MYSFDNYFYPARCDDYVSAQTMLILAIYSHFAPLGFQEEKQLSVHISFHLRLLSFRLSAPTFRHPTSRQLDDGDIGSHKLIVV